jgi:hypothetical protein
MTIRRRDRIPRPLYCQPAPNAWRKCNLTKALPNNENEHPAYTYRRDSLNINGIATPPRNRLLEDFLHRNDIDLMCIQEITNINIKEIKHYEAHVNIGEKGRRMALLVKEAYILSDVWHMQSGRGISANFHGVQILSMLLPMHHAEGRGKCFTIQRSTANTSLVTDFIISRRFQMCH